MDFWHRQKSAFQKLVQSDPVMKSCGSAFILLNKSQEDISEMGKDLVVDLFGGKPKYTLSSLRHIIFTKKVATAKAFVSPERVPQLPLQQHSVAYVCITKLWYGWAWQMT